MSFDASTEMNFLERAGQLQYDVRTEWQANVSASRGEIKRRWWSDLQYVSPSVGPPKRVSRILHFLLMCVWRVVATTQTHTQVGGLPTET